MKPPRRSSTVYIHFFKDFIEKHDKVSSLAEMAGVSKEASSAWKDLTQSERQVCSFTPSFRSGNSDKSDKHSLST